MKKNYSGRRGQAFLIVWVALLLLPGCSASSELEVTLLKVGKADAIIAISGTQAMLIDAGEEEDGREVVEFLLQRGISEIDAMIITHFDRDHVGGADTVLKELPVKTAYVPDYESTHPEYLDFIAAVESSHVPLQRLIEPTSFGFGDATVLIEPPVSYEIQDDTVDFDNDFSLITTIQHGKNRLVFMGDAEKHRTRQWLEDSCPEHCNFLKIPHHGIYNKSLEDLCCVLEPQYSVICSSQKNPAAEKTLKVLKQYCSEIFETKDGDVRVISDGSRLDVQQKN